MIFPSDPSPSINLLMSSLKEIEEIRRKVIKGIEEKVEWIRGEEAEESEYIGIDGSSSRISLRYFIMYILRAAAFPTPGDSILNLGLLFPVRIKRTRISTMLTSLENLLAIYEARTREKDLMMDGLFSSGVAVKIGNLNEMTGGKLHILSSSKKIKEFLEECKNFWKEEIEEGDIIRSKGLFSLRSSSLLADDLKGIEEDLPSEIDKKWLRPILETLECLLTYDSLIGEAKRLGIKVVYLAKSSYSSKLIEGFLKEGEREIGSFYLTDYMIVDEISNREVGFLRFLDSDAYLYMFSLLYKTIYNNEGVRKLISNSFPNIYEIYEKIQKGILKRDPQDLDGVLSVSYARFAWNGDVHKIEVLNGKVDEEMPKIMSTIGARGYPHPLKEAHRLCKINRRVAQRFYKAMLSQLASKETEHLIYGFKSSREVLGE